MEERLIELETKLSFQDEALRKLAAVVEEHQTQFYRMHKELERLKAGLRTLESSQGEAPANEPPPHY